MLATRRARLRGGLSACGLGMYCKLAPEQVCTEETRTNNCVCALSLAIGLPREVDGVISIWVQFSRGVGSQPLFQLERPSLSADACA